MTSLTKGIFIVAAKRTPFATYGGVFSKTSATELQTVAMKAALDSIKLPPGKVDSVVVGHVMPNTSSDGALLPRHAALRSGIPVERPALSVNRLCGSGFQAIVNGAQNIQSGDSIVMTGGAENMSQAPFVVRNLRFGTRHGTKIEFEDYLWSSLYDPYCNLSMGLTAEKIGEMYNLTREEVDQYGLRSQLLYKKAHEDGRFKEEMIPVTVKIKEKDVIVDKDDHPRPQTTIEALRKLSPVFKKDGLVTAGSSSGICDGAGAVIVASEEAMKSNNLTPLARLVGFSIVGVDPSIPGIAPAHAFRNLLKAAGKTMEDIDLFEMNEAFAPKVLAVAKDMKLDMNKLNVNGGAISIGHPLAASGARITAHTIYELRRRKARLGAVSACIGGGQGIALLLESY